MITPVGENSEMTAAAVRAGISSYSESDLLDVNYNKVKLSQVPQPLLDDCLQEEKISGALSSRLARLLQLSTLALMQLKQNLSQLHSLPVFISLAENINVTDEETKKVFISNLAVQCEIDLDVKNSLTVSTGRAGGLEVIDLAIRYLDSCDGDYVLVGGVDTFYDKSVIDDLLKEGRLNIEGSAEGFIPGEGAAFLLLSRNPVSGVDVVTPYIFEPGFGYESGHINGSEAYKGDGLSTAISNALGDSELQSVSSVYSSMNGESYFSKEYGVSLIRNDSFFTDFEINHPADCFGDLGAAICVVMIGLAYVAIQQEKNGSPYLIYGSSDSALRTAAIVAS